MEDTFDRALYLKLVNQEFKSQLKCPIILVILNSNFPRIIEAIEDYLEQEPMRSGKFNHYRPTRYMSENIETLGDMISEKFCLALKKRF